MSHYALIAFGANIGDPRANIEDALLRLGANFPILKVSSLYRTKAVGGPAGQPDFLNGVAEIRPDGSPEETMKILLKIEQEMGRVRTERWGPRNIDLDLLDQDGVIIDKTGLIIPHPRLHERAFVLEPLAEIAPNWRHPVLRLTVGELLEKLSAEERAVILGKERLH